jgi:hypothetical protein
LCGLKTKRRELSTETCEGTDMSEEEPRLPIEQVLPKMGLHALPEKWTPIEALTLIKCLDEEGRSGWCYRTTSPPNREELLGALIVHTDLLRKELLDEWDEDEDK